MDKHLKWLVGIAILIVGLGWYFLFYQNGIHNPIVNCQEPKLINGRYLCHDKTLEEHNVVQSSCESSGGTFQTVTMGRSELSPDTRYEYRCDCNNNLDNSQLAIGNYTRCYNTQTRMCQAITNNNIDLNEACL